MTNNRSTKVTVRNWSPFFKYGSVITVASLLIASAAKYNAVFLVVLNVTQWLYLAEIKVPSRLFSSSLYSDVLGLVILALVVSIPFVVVRIIQPFQTAFMSTAVSVSVIALFNRLLTDQLNSLFLNFLLALLSTLLVCLVIPKIKKRSISWALVLLTIGYTTYVQPQIISAVQYKENTEKSEMLFKDSLKNLDFEVFYPSYVPASMELSDPILDDYTNRQYANKNVQFTLDRIEVTQGALLGNQDRIMNFTDHCDISLILSTTLRNPKISEREVKRSLSRPTTCNLVATTVSGKKIYTEESGQWVWFYTQIGSTNIVFEFDRINGQEYDPSFQPEIIKIIDSLEILDKDKVKRGSP